MSDPNPTSHRAAVATAVFVTVLWSSSWVVIRWGLEDESLPPLTFAALRYGLAALILGGMVLGRPALRSQLRGLGRRDIWRMIVLGIVFYAVTQGAQFVAIANQPAATTSLVLSWTPLLVAATAGRTLSESPTSRQVAGAALVVVGAWIFFAGDLEASSVGMTAAIVGLAANVGAGLLGRGVNREGRRSPTVVTGVSMAIGAAALAMVAVAVEELPRLSIRGLVMVGWLAIVNTAVAFTLWNRSLRHLTALESAAINNTMLIQIAVLAWLLLDEPLGLEEIGGILLVTAGVSFTQTVRLGTRRTSEKIE